MFVTIYSKSREALRGLSTCIKSSGLQSYSGYGEIYYIQGWINSLTNIRNTYKANSEAMAIAYANQLYDYAVSLLWKEK